MVLGFFAGAGGIPDLLARKKYDKALELLRAEFRGGNRDPHARLQFADVLVMASREQDALPILLGLADEFAVEGYAAKAISVLKKVEKIDPERRDVHVKLAKLIKQKARDAEYVAAPAPPPRPSRPEVEFGMEEIGMEPPPEPPPAPQAVPDEPSPRMEQESAEPRSTEPSEEGAAADRLGVDEDLLERSSEPAHAPSAANAAPPTRSQPRAIGLASPLFSSFEQDELVEVIRGLRLLSYAPGDIVITEGQGGDSLFVLTSGVVKTFVRDPGGANVLLRELEEGSFFGEISILSGQPRTATITAGTQCELLELDRPTLDAICETHPRVREVLQQFYEERVGSDQDKRARAGK